MQKVGLINGISNENCDYDYSAGFSCLTGNKGGVCCGTWDNLDYDLTNLQVKSGMAFVPITRPTTTVGLSYSSTAVYYNTTPVSVPKTPNTFVWIELDTSKVDDPTLIFGDSFTGGENIGSIKYGSALPTTGYFLPLYKFDASGTLVDLRNCLTLGKGLLKDSCDEIVECIESSDQITLNNLVVNENLVVNKKLIVEGVDVANLLNNTGSTNITENCIIALEEIPALTPVYISENVQDTSVTLLQSISNTSSTNKITVGAIGNGLSSNKIILRLSKTGNPSGNLNVRIETDNDGSPSGTLVNTNSMVDILPSAISSSLSNITITFPGSFSVPSGNVWIVLSSTFNTNNYYNIGYANNAGSTFLGQYNGTDWEVNKIIHSGLGSMLQTGVISSFDGNEMQVLQDSAEKMSLYPETQGFKTDILNYDNIVISGDTYADAGGSNSSGSTVSGFTIKYDNSNYIRLWNKNSWQLGGASFKYISYEIVENGFVLANADIGGGGFSAVDKLKISKLGNVVVLSKWNGSAWVNLYSNTVLFTGSYSVYASVYRTGTSNNYNEGKISNVLVTTYDYSTASNSGFSTYISGDFFNLRGYKIAYANSINTLGYDGIPRIVLSNTKAGSKANVITEGIIKGFSGLKVTDLFAFVSDTGTVSSTPGTNIFPLGRIVNSNTIYVGNVIYHDNLIPNFTYSGNNSRIGNTYRSIGDKSIDVDMYVDTSYLEGNIYFQWSIDNTNWNNISGVSIGINNIGGTIGASVTRTYHLSGGVYYRFVHNGNIRTSASVSLSHVSII